ncbi:DUF397 domain-containing protein [Nonomuraea sp. NPDC049480]|uniref:DUF397 domain-containing protein n=1 Tax=Nonomuraea sp. NPDC049480 TaxID=3364353 RepID=UPI0037B62F0D
MEHHRPLIAWRKSSKSADVNCVEVSATADHVLVRNSRDRNGPVLAFTRAEWSDLLRQIKRP